MIHNTKTAPVIVILALASMILTGRLKYYILIKGCGTPVLQEVYPSAARTSFPALPGFTLNYLSSASLNKTADIPV